MLCFREEWLKMVRKRIILFRNYAKKPIRFSKEENKELEEFKAEKTGKPCDALEPWEVGFWSEN